MIPLTTVQCAVYNKSQLTALTGRFTSLIMLHSDVLVDTQHLNCITQTKQAMLCLEKEI